MSHPELNNLLNAAVPFAKHMLSEDGEFSPFGVVMKMDGAVSIMDVFAGLDDGDTGTGRLSPHEIIDLLTKSYRQKADAKTIRAAGICYDVRTIPPGQTDKCDAICVSLEHQDGEAVDVLLPYKKASFGRMAYGSGFVCPRDRSFFVNNPR